MENYSINRVELRGRIGQEPKLSVINGSQVCKFSLATSEIYKDKSGEIKEDTTWHNITGWQSKTLNDFSVVQKGALVTVKGRIRNAKFAGADGEDHRINEIVATSITPFSAE